MKSTKPRSTARRRRVRDSAACHCEYCGERLVRDFVSVYRRRGVRHILFENVPALVCRSCGHREFEADAVENMEHRLSKTVRRGKKAELLVIPA